MSYQVLSSYQLLTFSKMINWLPDYLIKVKLVKSQKCSLWSWCWCNFCDDDDIESIINQFDVHEILRLRELLAIAGRHSGEVSHSQLTVLLKGQVLFASVVGGGRHFLNIYHIIHIMCTWSAIPHTWRWLAVFDLTLHRIQKVQSTS